MPSLRGFSHLVVRSTERKGTKVRMSLVCVVEPGWQADGRAGMRSALVNSSSSGVRQQRANCMELGGQSRRSWGALLMETEQRHQLNGGGGKSADLVFDGFNL